MHEQTPTTATALQKLSGSRACLSYVRTILDPTIELISAKMLPKRMAEYDIVSHWEAE